MTVNESAVSPLPEVADFVASIRAKSADLDIRIAELHTKLDQATEDRIKAQTEFATKARSGELGPAMKRLQNRIDGGLTTRDAALNGDDTSPEAQAFLNGYQDLIRATREKLDAPDEPTAAPVQAFPRAQPDADEVEASQWVEARASLARLTQLQEEIQRNVESFGGVWPPH